jgi:DNA-binding MarR family transcriptional regulator
MGRPSGSPSLGVVPASAATTRSPSKTDEQVVDSLLAASRALVAIAARSLADQDVEVTLPQYRALVVLASRGPQRVVDISAELGVDPSTGTRLCDRLVRKGLVRRQRSTSDRRVVRVTLTPAGRKLVDQVTLRRRGELSRVVTAMSGQWPRGVAAALHRFAEATGEIPEEQWWMGWLSPESPA